MADLPTISARSDRGAMAWRYSASAVFFDKIYNRKVTKVVKCMSQSIMRPVPPSHFHERLSRCLIRARTDGLRRYAGNDRVGRDILGHDRTCADHTACGDLDAGQQDYAVTDPDIMAEGNFMPAAPIEKVDFIIT